VGQIYLVRHGQASFGAEDYDELSELGAKQSRLLGGWLAHLNQPLSCVVTGGLKRHRQTADACMAAVPENLRPPGGWKVDAGFDEYDHHEMLLRHKPEFADPVKAKRTLEQADPNPRKAFQKIFSEAMARWMSGRHDRDYRESWPDFRARCSGALRKLIDDSGASQTAIVFTSGGPITAICQDILGMPDERAAALNYGLVNSAMTKLLYQPGRVSLCYLNSFPHLEQTGEPKNITYR
jgi:broad specificity phosphatase PhoE